ncbi:MAG: hypothetical protein WBE18_08810 [Gammaproteobacteria bacterium]
MKCGRIWMFIVVVLALVIATMAALWPQDRLMDVIYVARFFDVMLPILAVGGLIQYLTGVCSRTWTIIIFILAFVVGIFASISPQQRLNELLLVSRFFDVALPILATGALIKYLGLVSRFWNALIILIAIIIAALAVVLTQGRLITVVYLTRFFDVMLPILAAGALIKYLCAWWCSSRPLPPNR